MNRRWSLIALIVVLSGALAFTIVDLNTGDSPGDDAEPGAAASDVKGKAWWPMDEKEGNFAHDAVGKRRLTLYETGWTEGPATKAADGGGAESGALLLDGGGFAQAPAPPLRTGSRDFSAAGRVRIDDPGRVCTAVSLDGRRSSVFFLQYIGGRFAFSFPGHRAVASDIDVEQGRWYHIAGTYDQDKRRLTVYVDGKAAASAQAAVQETPSGYLAVGRGKFDGKAVDVCRGAVADVHVYEHALTPADVTSLAEADPAP